MPKSLVEMSADIVAAQSNQKGLSAQGIVESLRKVFEVLQEVHHLSHGVGPEAKEWPDPLSSIQRHQVICLECGRSFQLLSNRHLALHHLTPREYKHKHGIRQTQPLSARTLSARRSKVSKELGTAGRLSRWRESRNNQMVSVPVE